MSQTKPLLKINAINDALIRCLEGTTKNTQDDTHKQHPTKQTEVIPTTAQPVEKIPPYFIQSFPYYVLSSQPQPKLMAVLTT